MNPLSRPRSYWRHGVYNLNTKQVRPALVGKVALQAAYHASVTYLATVGCLFIVGAVVMRRSAHPLSCWIGPIETKQLLFLAAMSAAALLGVCLMISRRPRYAYGAFMIIVGSLLAGCAGPQASGSYQTSASYSRLYNASLRAAPAVGYTIVSSNKADGMIVAQQGVIMGGGSAAGLSSHISDEDGHRVLQVNFTAPPGTLALGGFGQNLTEYVNNIKTSVPDLSPR